MANILIGQLSYRFEMAQTDAAMQLDIDKAKMITQMERSWFKLLVINFFNTVLFFHF